MCHESKRIHIMLYGMNYVFAKQNFCAPLISSPASGSLPLRHLIELYLPHGISSKSKRAALGLPHQQLIKISNCFLNVLLIWWLVTRFQSSFVGWMSVRLPKILRMTITTCGSHLTVSESFNHIPKHTKFGNPLGNLRKTTRAFCHRNGQWQKWIGQRPRGKKSVDIR